MSEFSSLFTESKITSVFGEDVKIEFSKIFIKSLNALANFEFYKYWIFYLLTGTTLLLIVLILWGIRKDGSDSEKIRSLEEKEK